MFDKLLVTTLMKMTHVLGTYHGPYLGFCGAPPKTGTQKKGSPSLEQGCPCAVCVCVPITSDKTTFSSRREFAEKHLHACPLSASVFKST